MKLKVLFLLALFPLLTCAQELKIGVVDMRSIVNNIPQAKTMMEKLKSEFKAREEKIMTAEKLLKEKTDKFQRNSAVMSETEKNKLEKEVLAAQRDLQRMQGDFREDAALRQQEETKRIIDDIGEAIRKIANKEKYQLIIHSEVAPFVDKQLDITEKVMKMMAN